MKKGVIAAFVCSCGDNWFEIITENTERTNFKNKTYFRCTECGKDYDLNEVNSLKEIIRGDKND